MVPFTSALWFPPKPVGNERRYIVDWLEDPLQVTDVNAGAIMFRQRRVKTDDKRLCEKENEKESDHMTMQYDQSSIHQKTFSPTLKEYVCMVTV